MSHLLMPCDFSRAGDDPYYCGLRARVPNFAKNKEMAMASYKEMAMASSSGGGGGRKGMPSSSSSSSLMQKGFKSPLPSRSVPNLQALQPQSQLPPAANPFWWHSRLYPDAVAPVGGNRSVYVKNLNFDFLSDDKLNGYE
jgi:hypothetical protein